MAIPQRRLGTLQEELKGICSHSTSRVGPRQPCWGIGATPLKYGEENTKTLGEMRGVETKNVLRQVLKQEIQMVDKYVEKCPTSQ